MASPPSKEELLAAIGEFLMNDLRPVVKDPRLSFRLLIAAHLTSVVGNELRAEAAHATARLERLRALLPDVAVAPKAAPDAAARRAAISALEAALVARLRQGGLAAPAQAAARRAVLADLRDELAVGSPQFDPRLDIPEEE
jgi:hypothetical protein